MAYDRVLPGTFVILIEAQFPFPEAVRDQLPEAVRDQPAASTSPV
jgi:hypothetical protein